MLLRVDDGAARRRARADSVLSAIVTAMASQRHFYRATETAIESLLKLGSEAGCQHVKVSHARPMRACTCTMRTSAFADFALHVAAL